MSKGDANFWPAFSVWWDARHACTRSLYARFSPQSIPQHTRFSTGQKHNGRGWRVKREDLDAYVKKL